jgi:hypothetical protein
MNPPGARFGAGDCAWVDPTTNTIAPIESSERLLMFSLIERFLQ